MEMPPRDSMPADNMPPAADETWDPGSGGDLQDFLERVIPDTAAAAIRIVEWRPSRNVFGEGYLRLLRETAEFIKRIDAGHRTLRGFGRRWFGNALRNAGLIRKGLIFNPGGTIPCVVTGAGPSLEEAIPGIKKIKRAGPCFILAASSSVPALAAAALTPDMAISTDGGGWALLHLYETARARVPALALSLSAALPSQCAETPALVLGDGSLWQTLILRSLGLPFISLPQRGTVTASALDLAFLLTGGPVYISGADLADRDIRTHARPYGFDRLREQGADRLSPLYSRTFIRARTGGEPESRRIYAEWFRRQTARYPRRLHSLGANNPAFSGADGRGAQCPENTGENGGAGLTGIAMKTIPRAAGTNPDPAEILVRALEEPDNRAALIRELGSLLLPDETDPPPGAIREAVLAAAKKRGGRGGE
jgi:hypothetical protein